MTYERSVFLPDLHAPYADETAFKTALAFVTDFRPSHIFLMGDWADFYQVSRFSRDPGRRFSLQSDLDDCTDHLFRLRDASPKAKILYLRGNHEYRLTKYLWTVADSLASLRSLTIPELLHFKTLRIEYAETGVLDFHGYIVKHGNLIRTRSGYTATGELEKAGSSGISAHSHRMSQVYRRNVGGMFSWTECGCLCRLDPEYAEGQVMDWQTGCAYGYFEKGDNRFSVHLLPIIKGKTVFDGREIVSQGRGA